MTKKIKHLSRIVFGLFYLSMVIVALASILGALQ